jgi:hypothetical protein
MCGQMGKYLRATVTNINSEINPTYRRACGQMGKYLRATVTTINGEINPAYRRARGQMGKYLRVTVTNINSEINPAYRRALCTSDINLASKPIWLENLNLYTYKALKVSAAQKL